MQNLKTYLFKTKHPSWMLFAVLGICVIAILFTVGVFEDGGVVTQVGEAPKESIEFPEAGWSCSIAEVPSVEDLTKRAQHIVRGEVTNITSAWEEDKHIHSTIILRPIESFKAPIMESITIRIYGGTVGEIMEIMGCDAQFTIGEEALVFLEPDNKKPEYSRVVDGFMGKFMIKRDKASRGLPDEPLHNLKQLGNKIKNIIGTQSFLVLPHSFSTLSDTWKLLSGQFLQNAEAFNIELTPGLKARRLPSDIPVSYYMDNDPIPLFGSVSFDKVRAAYSNWSNAGANISLVDAGIVNVNTSGMDGKNMFIFKDFNNMIGSGVLAVTAAFIDFSQTIRVNDTLFYKISEADIVVNDDNWTADKWWATANNFWVIAAHELGHTIGLGHSEVSDAIMAIPTTTITTRTTLHQDDINGVRFIYPANLNPIGWHDLSNCTATTGWAYDPDSPDTPVSIHVYKDGPAGTGVGLGATTANRSRDFPGIGLKNWGFSFPTPDSIRQDNQPHDIYVYAIDNENSGVHPLLPVAVSRTIPACNRAPQGFHDNSTCTSITGWAYDPDSPNTPVSIHVYKDGPAGTRVGVGTTTANRFRSDLGRNWGFSFSPPDSVQDGGRYTIYVYAIDNENSNIHPLLPPANNEPERRILECEAPTGWHDLSDCIATTGWAYDPDSPNTPVSIHVYKDGPAGTGVGVGTTTANRFRSDLGRNWGFSFPTPDSIKNDNQPHDIYVYAIDNENSGVHPLLPVTLSRTIPACNIDSDNDGFTDAAEQYMGTNPNLACPATSTANDEHPDAWPPDFNDNGIVQIDDVTFVSGKFGRSSGQPGYTPRAELASQNGIIQIDDIAAVSGLFGKTCSE